MSKTRITIPDPALEETKFNSMFKLDAEKLTQLDVLKADLNLNTNRSNTPPFPWDYIKAAMMYRQENYYAFKESMKSMSEILSNDEQLAKAFMGALEPMKGKFVGIFAANKIDPGSYHTYPHGVEMSKDPGEFTTKFYAEHCSSPAEAMLWKMMVDVVGAAHDIIQGKAPPINERESAEIYITEMRKMLDKFIEDNKENLDQEQRTALTQFRDNAVPFLANECLINGTFLLFNSGKRDFANVLQKVHEIISPKKPEFDGDVKLSGAIMAVALSDTRRSEMIHVMQKQELLNSVPDHLMEPLEKVLRIIGILNEGEKIADLRTQNDKRLPEIEGFLLRVGQNIRMTTEFANDRERLSILAASRVAPENTFDVSVDPAKHIQPFINAISGPFGESSFARALGEIDQKELLALAEKQGIKSLVEGNLDLTGWQNHAVYLEKLQAAYPKLEPKDLQAIATVLIFIAAKPPGHRISPEIYQGMKDEHTDMKKSIHEMDKQISAVKWSDMKDEEKQVKMSELQRQKEGLEKKSNCLGKEMTEIEKANPGLAPKKESRFTAEVEQTHTRSYSSGNQ